MPRARLLDCRWRFLLGTVALLAPGCGAAHCQSMRSTLEQGSQSTSGNSGQGPANAGGQSSIPLGASSVMTQNSTQTAAAARKLNRKITSAAAPRSAENFCFQPGVGWVIQHRDAVTGTNAFQTIPPSVGVAALTARRMPQSSSPDECNANAGSSSSLQAAEASSFGLESTGAGDAGEQSQLQGSSGAPQGQGSGTNSGGTISVLQPGPGDVTYSFGTEQSSQTVTIRTSLTRTGNVVMSVIPPEMAITRTVGSAELLESRGQPSTLLDNAMTALGGQPGRSSSFSFLPGQPQSADSTEANERLSQDRIAEDERHVVGREPLFLNQQQKRAASGETFSAADLHGYMRIHRACTRAMDQIPSAGGDLPSPQGLTSREADQVDLLRKGCTQFLGMDKAAALKYLAKRHGLE